MILVKVEFLRISSTSFRFIIVVLKENFLRTFYDTLHREIAVLKRTLDPEIVDF